MDAEERSTEISMEELAALVDTAGADTIAMVLQTRQSPDPRSFLGAGKLQEIKEIVTNNECDLVVIDNELSPSQARAIEEELGVRVVDRSGLILDIFAQRARTKEGRLQVQLAQYEYLLPRLTGMWTHLKRQAGTSAPIGTRGPGETQLETDRRHIRRIIQNLQADLEQVRRVRSTQRRRREKNAMPMVALVGYTNAGKSTVLNRLTRSDIPANDRLFDTLDTTTRRLWLPELQREIRSPTPSASSASCRRTSSRRSRPRSKNCGTPISCCTSSTFPRPTGRSRRRSPTRSSASWERPPRRCCAFIISATRSRRLRSFPTRATACAFPRAPARAWTRCSHASRRS